MTMVYSNLFRALFLLSIELLVLQCQAYKPLSDATLKSLPQPGDAFDIHKGELLAPILRPRVPGTPGSIAVLNHFVDFFKSNLPDWNIEFQNSTSKTPVTGDRDVPFVNLIASRDPPWANKGDVSRLNLVAHYDSKYEPEGFIGATDSAAPCAIIMHAVRSIDTALTKKWAEMEAEGTPDVLDDHGGIQVVFLDGEEAFHHWSKEDSLYGARSLAETWEHQANPAMSTYKTPLSSISLFMLLDLLGAKDPNIPSYFKTTHWAYQGLAVIEHRLRKLDQFKTVHRLYPDSAKHYPKSQLEGFEAQWFSDMAKDPSSTFSSFIQDDHLPFMARGVEILHLIAYPFPDVWHKITDDGEHLDIPTVEDWAMIITAFAAEWMELEGHFDNHSISDTRHEDVPSTESGTLPQKRDVWDKPEL